MKFINSFYLIISPILFLDLNEYRNYWIKRIGCITKHGFSKEIKKEELFIFCFSTNSECDRWIHSFNMFYSDVYLNYLTCFSSIEDIFTAHHARMNIVGQCCVRIFFICDLLFYCYNIKNLWIKLINLFR